MQEPHWLGTDSELTPEIPIDPYSVTTVTPNRNRLFGPLHLDQKASPEFPHKSGKLLRHLAAAKHIRDPF